MPHHRRSFTRVSELLAQLEEQASSAAKLAQLRADPRELRMPQPLVGLIMGSKSDWDTMQHAADMLKALGVEFETQVVSAPHAGLAVRVRDAPQEPRLE